MSERQYLAEENAKLRAEVELLRGCHSGCPCQACGEEFREDVMLPDAMWNEIRPHGKPPGGGLLCGRCIGLLMFGRLQLAQDRFAQLQEAATQADSRADKAEAQLVEERAEVLNVCHDAALMMESWVNATAEMHARELAGYREREAEVAEALDALTDAEQYHSRARAKDKPHDHALLRKLQATIKSLAAPRDAPQESDTRALRAALLEEEQSITEWFRGSANEGLVKRVCTEELHRALAAAQPANPEAKP